MKELAAALQRLIDNTATAADRRALRLATLTGDLEFTQNINIGGNVQDSVVIAGTSNTVLVLPPTVARTVKMALMSHPLIRVATAPPPPTLFVGRQEEMRILRERLLAASQEGKDRTQVLTARGESR